MVDRDWSAAARKKLSEGVCRIEGCKRRDVQAAHTIGREEQDEFWERGPDGEEEKIPGFIASDGSLIYRARHGFTKVRRVLAASTVPLCVEHHMLYDAYKLDLLAEARFISPGEHADAARAVGVARAYRRMSGREVEG